MCAKRLKDMMPKRPRRWERLPKPLSDRVTRLYRSLQEVPFIQKQPLEQWMDRFCGGPEPEREIAVWEWLAREYEKRTTGMRDRGEKNHIFRQLLAEAMDYEPLGVRKLPD
ncbi:MAG: hypothetical protein JSU72_02475 [Deltaproteobacteria bacterium]|nr:MAG: hypothetical protein JSU72_02475 [Deltaproteobacteria bacterium]